MRSAAPWSTSSAGSWRRSAELPDELARPRRSSPIPATSRTSSPVAAPRRGGAPGAARARPARGQAPPARRPAAARAGRARAGPEDHQRDRGAAHQEAARVLPARAAPIHPAGAGREEERRQRSRPSSAARSRRRGLPEEARREAERELTRLASLPPASPEHGMIVTYLEWMASLPWNKLSGGDIDIRRARQVLDEDHFDLEKVKDRILEYLAVKKLRQERAERAGRRRSGDASCPPSRRGHRRHPAREPILCFVGPPGVGKTSLGQSIARALGRRFVRMSLGGVRDEAEIRGPSAHLHRRAAGPHHPGPAARRDARSRLHARRDRQDRRGLARRSLLGAARGARSRAEPHLRGQLPRRAVRPLAGALHRHRQHARHHPRAPARPDGDPVALRLHGRGEGRDRHGST